MTDYERTTTRETTAVDPVPTAAPAPTPTYADPPLTQAPIQATAVRTTEREFVPAGPSGLTTAARIVTFAFGVLQAALILRIILLLLVANQANDVVGLILGITDPFVEPFRGMFQIDRVTADQGSRFDIAAVVALIGWTLIEMLILAAMRIFARRPSEVA